MAKDKLDNTSSQMQAHRSPLVTRAFVLLSPRRQLGKEEGDRRQVETPLGFPTLCLVPVFFFLVSVSFSAGLALTRTPGPHTLKLPDGNLIQVQFQSTPPLSGESLLFPKSVVNSSWPRVIRLLTPSLQNLLGSRRLGSLVSISLSCQRDTSQQVSSQHSCWSGTRSHFHDPRPLANWTRGGHLTQPG